METALEEDTASLPALATGIRNAHTAALAATGSALESARRAGELLVQAKDQLKTERGPKAHGEWLPWLAANCPAVSTRVAQKYMRLHRGWAHVEKALNTRPGTYLSLKAALTLLAKPSDDEDADPDELSPGGTDEEAPAGSEATTEAPPESHIREVKLTYTVATEEAFRRLLHDLEPIFGTSNDSDTVLRVVEYAHDTLVTLDE